MQNEITITAEQIEKLIKTIEKQEKAARKYQDAGREIAAARRDGIALGITHVLDMLGVEY